MRFSSAKALSGVVQGWILAGFQILEAAVRFQAAGQLGRNAAVLHLLRDPLRFIDKMTHLFQSADTISHQNRVASRQQYKSCQLFIVGGKLGGGEGQGQFLRLTRLEQPGLLECPQFQLRHIETALGRGRIDLHHFPARRISGVGYPDSDRNFLVISLRNQRFQTERGVGQAKTKGIVDFLRRTGDRLKISVAHENILGVADIIPG